MPSDWHTSTEPDLSIVVPVYQSAATLESLVERLHAALAPLERSYELVLVDDGSRDDSWNVLCRLQAVDSTRIVAIGLMRNFGQHNALMCGLRAARGAIVVTLDDDLQNPPEEIPKLLGALEDGQLDLVYGQSVHRQHAPWRNLGSWIVGGFYRVVFRNQVRVSSFRAIRRELAQAILSYHGNFTFLDGLLAWNTQRLGQVAVEHHPRRHGRSNYSPARLVLLALNLWTSFSLLPLHLASLLGFLLATAGFATGIFYLARYWLNQITVSGYASTIIAILVLGGTQLMALGVLSEYVGRLHLNVNCKPQYSVRRVAASNAQEIEQRVGRVAVAGLHAATPEPELARNAQ